MKRLYSLLTLLLVAHAASAVVITEQQALRTAARFVRQNLGAAAVPAVRRASSAAATAVAARPVGYYAFNIGQQQGYLLVAADDRVGGVVMYGTRGDFPQEHMPDAMRAFLAGVESACDYVQQCGDMPASARRADGDRPDILPLVATHWDQVSPYNLLCPILPYNHFENRAYTGCVATAMAQIMAVYRQPAATTALIPAYSFRYQDQEYSMDAVPAGTAIDWTGMRDDYALSPDRPTAADSAVAALMALCGASVQMRYGTDATGGSTANAQDAAAAFVRYFGMEERTVRDIARREYSYARWADIIYAELAAGRPVLYYGQSPENGHAFVCDGYRNYQGFGFFHINWGWGGQSDTYVDLRACLPESQGAGGGGYGYSMSQGAVIGLQPDDGKVSDSGTRLTVDFIQTENLATTFTRQRPTDDFGPVGIVRREGNYTACDARFDAGLRLTDASGGIISETADASLRNYQLGSNYYVSLTTYVSLPASLADGTYRLTPVSRKSGTTEWFADFDSDLRYIEFRIEGNTLQVTAMHRQPDNNISIDGDILIQGEMKAGRLHRASFYLTNSGTDFHDDLYYVLNEATEGRSFTYGCFAEVPAGYRAQCSIDFVPTRSGLNTISIYGPDRRTLLGTASLTLEGQPDIKAYTADVANFDAGTGAIVDSRDFDVTIRLVNEGTAEFRGSYQVFLASSEDVANPFRSATIMRTEDWMSSAVVSWTDIVLQPGEGVERRFCFQNLDRRFTSSEVPFDQRAYFLYFANTADRYDWFYSDAFRVVSSTGVAGTVAGPDAPQAPAYTLQGIRWRSGVRGIGVSKGRKVLAR